uniref:Uncharacterized protein n=1 Tax=Chromera velia CCMP2878 TaxID=1169474 RepID=A0A0G4H9F6_9ALVE|eukprot:Cvel_25392.t1-p1 / transcript=Cvel_25392.t1 / gene=Cvel_25392 / organism=Chromera_velia_CCMP2878 / gene_product=hypothetical protein / transcript_product=hypothetical protein / location=Cvel_scaffold2871:273-548(+) / protein_length=92 / sequence_SO=supercontig / SO=protein_coding / is_pseudo=false
MFSSSFIRRRREEVLKKQSMEKTLEKEEARLLASLERENDEDGQGHFSFGLSGSRSMSIFPSVRMSTMQQKRKTLAAVLAARLDKRLIQGGQ